MARSAEEVRRFYQFQKERVVFNVSPKVKDWLKKEAYAWAAEENFRGETISPGRAYGDFCRALMAYGMENMPRHPITDEEEP